MPGQAQGETLVAFIDRMNMNAAEFCWLHQ